MSLATGQITIQNINETLNVSISPSSYVFPGAVSTALPGTVDVLVEAFLGKEPIACTIESITPSSTSLLTSVTSGANGSKIVRFEAKDTLSASGIRTISVKAAGTTINKTFSYSIAFKGAPGVRGPEGGRGVGVSSVEEWYLATAQATGVTDLTSDWSTTIQAMTPTKKYLWNYEKIKFTDNTVSPTNPVIIGVYGDQGVIGPVGPGGAEGRAITGVEEFYLISDKATGVLRTTTPTEWKTTPPLTTPEKRYLWNYEKITWNKGTTPTYVEPFVIGVHGAQGKQGEKGLPGVSVKSVDVEYYRSTQPTSLVGGSWSTTAPAWLDGTYMWSKTVTTYVGTTDRTESKPICITGAKGGTGPTGQGVESITEQFALSPDKDKAPLQESNLWQNVAPTWVENQYMWTRSKIVYKNPTATEYKGISVDTAWEAANNALDEAKEYVKSRGENLVTNGTGLLKNNTNFKSFTFDGSDTYGSTGSFTRKADSTVFADELMPINPDLNYKMSYFTKANPYKGARAYGMIVCYDSDGNSIGPQHTMYKANTLTTLAQELKKGDTVIKLASASNWENAGGTGVHLRTIIFWNYKNSSGFLYPPLTYSRNLLADAWLVGGINYATNTITLKVPWAGSTIPAGTPVSNGSSGSSYKYISGSNYITPAEWTKYEGTISGIDDSGTNHNNKFHPGTAAVKIGWLLNRSDPESVTWLSNVSFQIDYQGNMDKIKGDLTDAISGVSTALGNLQTNVTGTFRDGIIEESEARSIEKYLNTLKAEKRANDTKYTQVHGNAALDDLVKSTLRDAKAAYDNNHMALLSAINNAIRDKKATVQEKNLVDSRFALYETALSDLAEAFEKAKTNITNKKVDATQTAIFESLTNGGADQGIFIKDEKVYINGQYLRTSKLDANTAVIANGYINNAVIKDLSASKIVAGRLQDKTGDSYWDLDNGVINLKVSSIKIGVKPVATEEMVDNTFGKISIGGRNLAQDSILGWTGSTYKILEGELSEGWQPGQEYTVSIKGTKHASQKFALYRDLGVTLATGEVTFNAKTGVHEATFLCPALSASNPIKTENTFSIYNAPNVAGRAYDIEWIKIEKGNRATDWTPAPEDVSGVLSTLVTSDEAARIETLAEEARVAADGAVKSDEFEEFLRGYDERKIEQDKAKEDAESALLELAARANLIELSLGDKAMTLDFLTRFITFANEGVLIGDKTSPGTGVLVSSNRISFMDGGKEVASISNQVMSINHGIFASSAKIGKHKMETNSKGTTIFTYIPEN